MKYLLFGGNTGWIGGMLHSMLKDCVSTCTRMQDREAVAEILNLSSPDRVIIAAGLTGRPNIDQLEDIKDQVIQTNVIGVLTVVDECHKRGIHCTYIGTGCIYEYSDKHPIGGKGFTEEDVPNFSGSYYSKTKIMVEELLKAYNNVLTLRVRMPISSDLHSRNFITKILNYEKIVNVPNSMTVLSDLLPILIDMSSKGKTGIYNFVNPGAVSHNEIMEMYKEIVKPDHTWTNFTLEQQSKVIRAGRSNCELDYSKLLLEYPNLPTAKDSIRKIMMTWAPPPVPAPPPTIPLFKVAMNAKVGDLLAQVITSGSITQGPKVEEFEKVLGNYIGNAKVLTLNSATSGLTLALRLLFKSDVDWLGWGGLEEGDEVLTTALTCTATNWPILANKLKIKWVDVDMATGNLDLQDLKNKLSPTTKVIMVVHWGGYPNDLDKLAEIQDYCKSSFGFRPMIIEDCAHAFGAEYNGKKLGCHGNICVFSFQAIKHLTTGDGGMIVLPSQTLYDRAKLLRWYGIDRNARNFNQKDFRLEKDIEEWGYKFHMNDISATIGLANFELAVANLEKHRKNAKLFYAKLDGLQGYGIQLMEQDAKCNGSSWIYSLKVERKQEFINFMKANGIVASQVHNRNDNHSCVAEYKVDLPNLDELEKTLICIPVGWWLTNTDISYIVDKIYEFYK